MDWLPDWFWPVPEPPPPPRIPDGTPGIRDVDAPCEFFEPPSPEGGSPVIECMTDGHYLCKECIHCPHPKKGSTPDSEA